MTHILAMQNTYIHRDPNMAHSDSMKKAKYEIELYSRGAGHIRIAYRI